MSVLIKSLCPHVSSAIFKYCVGARELAELGLPSTAEGEGLALQARALHCLSQLCREREGPCRGLADLLDLKFLNTVLTVRDMSLSNAHDLGKAWVASPGGEALPGLIWALCTDPRVEVQRVGYELSMEADWIGRQRLIFEQSAAEGR